jgi:hypothetical protein
MAGKRKPVPMETQPGRCEAATPMAQTSSKRDQAPVKPTSAMQRSQAEAARKRSLKKQRSMLHE